MLKERFKRSATINLDEETGVNAAMVHFHACFCLVLVSGYLTIGYKKKVINA